MPEASPTAPSASFVKALLRKGSSVLARSPQPDLDSMPDWRTVVAVEEDGDSILMRASRYAVLGGLLYRVAGFPKVFIGYVSNNGTLGLAPVLSATVVAVAVNVAAVIWVLRGPGIRAKVVGRMMAVDLGFGVLLNLAVAVSVPARIQPFAVDVTWTWMVGSIVLWASFFGIGASLAMLAASVPVRAGLTLAGGLPLTDPLALNRSVGCFFALVVAMFVAAGILVVLGVGTRFALGIGMREGRQAERLRYQRVMHDGVLQTLEAMSMATPSDRTQAADRLDELRAAARAQAAEIRRELVGVEPPEVDRGLAAELAEVATEMARDGLRTQLVAAESDQELKLSQARRDAMCDAVREAMRNTIKHAGTNQVVLRIEEREGGIAVVARDHGDGFSMREQPPGFGISQSIIARLAEVGGRGTIDSRPGRGTRVTLWVPR
ncbi:Signal transduction histidine kinase [Amycolatopsis xylanica]|uniref:Signal transduction histidine kinase n=1 Tax=Amycolatopsis xylanica TaxID=589385 RepID=A0A1H3PA28_9PSEU|nr:ATP-binding protein [Amycolatopsis xylanica]SDY97982.1 Signal transduction histidine kinase [Amycolatopsis xylanica]